MPWRIPESDLEQVKRETDLVALVQSRGIELHKHGVKDWVGRCPFHQDNQNPNFIVSPAKGLFHCMACGKAGNAIQPSRSTTRAWVSRRSAPIRSLRASAARRWRCSPAE